LALYLRWISRRLVFLVFQYSRNQALYSSSVSNWLLFGIPFSET